MSSPARPPLTEEAKKTLIDEILKKDASFKDIFGVTESGDAEERGASYRKAYRQLALNLHPDKNPGNDAAAEAFKKVRNFYEAISNPENNWSAEKASIAMNHRMPDERRNQEDAEAENLARNEEREAWERGQKEEARKGREREQQLNKKKQEQLNEQAKRKVLKSQERALKAAKRSQAILKSPSETIADPANDCALFLRNKDGSRALLSYVRAHQKGDSSGLPEIKDIFDKIVQRKSVLGVTPRSTQNPISPLTKSELLEIINTKPQNLLQSKRGYDVITELLRASAEKLDLHDLLDVRKNLNILLEVRRGGGDNGAKSCVAETNKIIEGKLRGILDEYVFREAGIKIETHDPSQAGGGIFELRFKVPDPGKVPPTLQEFNLTVGMTYTSPMGRFAKLGFSARPGRGAKHSPDEAPITLLITEETIRTIADKQQERIGDDLKLIQYALLENDAISDPKNIKCLESHSGCRYQIKLETDQDPEEFKQKISNVLGIDPELFSIKGGEIEIAIAETKGAEILKNLESERQKLKQCEILHSFLIEAGVNPDAVTFRKNDEGNFTCSLENSDENQRKIQPPFTLNAETAKLELSVNSKGIKSVDERVQKLGFSDQPQCTMESLGRELKPQEEYRDAVGRETRAPKPPHAEKAAAQKSPSSSPQPIECVSLLTRIKKFLGIDDKKSTKPVVKEWNEDKPSTIFKPTSAMELIKMVINLFKGSGR